MGQKIDQAKGRVKQATGDLTDDDRLKREGKLDEVSGKVKGAFEDLKDRAEGAVDAVKGKMDRR